MDALEKTLHERGSRYGDFATHASLTQAIKTVMQSAPNWGELQPDQKEALEMVAHKIGRILNGDPDYVDSWHDIAGYAALVEKRLAAKDGEAEKMSLAECPPDDSRKTPNEKMHELTWAVYGNGRFVKRADGVYFIEQDQEGNDKPALKLCSLLHVVAKIRNNKGEEWGRLLQWQDDDNHTHQWDAPLSLLKIKNGERVRMELARQGAITPIFPKERRLFSAYLLNWPVD